MKHTLFALAAAGLIAVGQPGTADARDRGGAVAAGVIGGVALGAILGGALANPGPRYYEPEPVYVEPPPPRRRVYVEEYGPVCHVERQRFWDGYGWRSRRVEVCD